MIFSTPFTALLATMASALVIAHPIEGNDQLSLRSEIDDSSGLTELFARDTDT
jgi:hypothetical protein